MRHKYFLQFFIAVIISQMFTACDSNSEPENPKEGFPTVFTVDIPSSISQKPSLKNTKVDNYSGKEIYQHLNNFIYVGESSAQLIEDIMKSIYSLGLDNPMELSYTSNEDGQLKNLVVVDNSIYEGITWQHQLTISDANSVSNHDGGKALQVFWNNNPVKGIAILKPKNWDISGTPDMGTAIFRVDYSEAKETGYDAEMTVTISNWEQDLADRFHMNNLKMFVGKTGNVVDVYGNSNHPDASLFLEEPVGYSWAFVASGNDDANIGVAEIGLPLSSLDETDRNILLVDNSIANIFTAQIREWVFSRYGVYPEKSVLDEYLINTEAPGFFSTQGFIQGGTAPSENYLELESNIQQLSPYNPLTISNLNIEFK